MRHRAVPDPMRPGRNTRVGYLVQSGNQGLVIADPWPNGKDVAIEPDEFGWFEVPHEAGLQLCRFREAGSGFYSEGEVGGEVDLKPVEAVKQPVSNGRKR